MASIFPQSLVMADMTSTRDGKTTDATQFLDLYKVKVGVQQVKAWGTGSIIGGVDNRGILYISVKDNAGTPVQLEGKIRICVRNANESINQVLFEEDTARLRGSKTDTSQAYRLGLITAYVAKQDSFLVVQFKARDATTAAKTIADANSDILLPVTTYAE